MKNLFDFEAQSDTKSQNAQQLKSFPPLLPNIDSHISPVLDHFLDVDIVLISDTLSCRNAQPLISAAVLLRQILTASLHPMCIIVKEAPHFELGEEGQTLCNIVREGSHFGFGEIGRDGLGAKIEVSGMQNVPPSNLLLNLVDLG